MSREAAITHEAPRIDIDIFQAEKRQRLRRLAGLGIAGRQPAIAGYCQTNSDERDQIVQAIILQKVGGASSVAKQVNECSYNATLDGGGTVAVAGAEIKL